MAVKFIYAWVWYMQLYEQIFVRKMEQLILQNSDVVKYLVPFFSAKQSLIHAGIYSLGLLPVSANESESCSVMSDSLRSHGLYSPCNSLGNTGVCSHSLLRGFPQPTILEWIAYPFYSGSSQPRSWTGVSCAAGRFFTCWTTREALLPITTSSSYNSFFLLISSDAQSWTTLCDCMDCSMPGFPVYHQLPELAQIHVHPVSNSIQPTYPLSSPYPSGTHWSKSNF